MSDWISLDPKTLDHGEKRNIKGVEFMLFISPYDMPEAVRGYYSREADRFMVEFRYITTDAARLEMVDRYVGLHVGKKTGRLHGIEVDVRSLKAETVSLGIVEDVSGVIGTAIRGLEERLQRRADRPNYEAVQKALEVKKDDVFRELVTA